MLAQVELRLNGLSIAKHSPILLVCQDTVISEEQDVIHGMEGPHSGAGAVPPPKIR